MPVAVASPVEEALGRLRDAVDTLTALDLTAVDQGGLLDLLRGVEAQRRRLPVHDHRLIAELEQRGVAGELCARDTKTLLRDVLRLSPREAKARYQAAVDLGPRRTVTGEALPPLFPRTAAAQAAGVISPDHAAVIRRAVSTLPAAVEWEHGGEVEATLVEHAGRFDPDTLAKLARHLHEVLDPDGTLPEDTDQQRRRDARLRENRDGSGDLRAHLTPECLAKWQAVLDPLAKPRPSDADGPDGRTAGQRMHDALEDCADRLLRSDTLPDAGGTPATVLLILTEQQARTGTGHAHTAHGGHIPTAQALRMADQADILPVTLAHNGAVLACGRTRRVATPTQRAALAARDRGCSFPSCDYPPSWCQAHHVIEWLDHGDTDIDNMTLLCGHHHREFKKRGWRVQMCDGIPWWTPPPRIDPEQKPIRNAIHDIAMESLRGTQLVRGKYGP